MVWKIIFCDLHTRDILVFRHVFYETIFPFHNDTPLTPSSHDFVFHVPLLALDVSADLSSSESSMPATTTNITRGTAY